LTTWLYVYHTQNVNHSELQLSHLSTSTDATSHN